VGTRMRDSHFDPHMRLRIIDARLERFERQAVITVTSASAVFLFVAVTTYSTLLVGAPV
jgi:hypothetical protein